MASLFSFSPNVKGGIMAPNGCWLEVDDTSGVVSAIDGIFDRKNFVSVTPADAADPFEAIR